MADLAPNTPGPAWRNGSVGQDGVSQRMDRFLVSIPLIHVFDHYNSWIQPSEISYHYPICMEWNNLRSCHLYPFKFNRSWLLEDDFSPLVSSSWKATSQHRPCDHLETLSHKLKRLKNTVKTWKRNKKLSRKQEMMDIDTEIYSIL